MKLNIYCTPTAARFARKLFLTPPLRRPLRHDSAQNCFSRHRCGAHCGTIPTKIVSHATPRPAPQISSLAMSTYGALILKLNIYCTPTAARFARKLFLTPPLRRPLRHEFGPKLFLAPPLRRPLRHAIAQNCFSRHRCGAHCGTILPQNCFSRHPLRRHPNFFSRHEHAHST